MLDGKDVSTLSESDRIKLRKGALGFVFQSFNLIDELNVSENIELPLLYMGVSAKERKEAVKAVIDRVAMGHRPCSHGTSCQALPFPALWRSAAACGYRPCRNLKPETHPCR